MYTWFYLSHVTGTPVVRPLFMLFPNTAAIDKQFMWGDALLVSPVVEQVGSIIMASVVRTTRLLIILK
jgi:alpha-glucosidase (family GH31 glycosyl hydrolase)